MTSMDQEQLGWYAIYTRSRHEKVVAEELWQRQIESFLPLQEILSKWKDRRKRYSFHSFQGTSSCMSSSKSGSWTF